MSAMIPNRELDQPRFCRNCGEDITQHARYTRWTQCSYCYWKGRLDHQPTVNELLKKRGDLKERVKKLEEKKIESIQQISALEQQRENNLPKWKKLLGITPRDDRLDNFRELEIKIDREVWDTRRSQESLEATIRSARHVRKQFDAATLIKIHAEKRRDQVKQRTIEFNSDSYKQAHNAEYKRDEFRIRKKDYKRGNPLDNHFRSGIAELVISSFGGCCLHCGGTFDLTLDHFAIPKNEGGNFVLSLRDKASIMLNVVVLCRSCNSAKGEKLFDRFFTSDEISRALDYQLILLKSILDDDATMAIIHKWFSK